MPTVAELLRATREARGLSVYQVAEITKIKTDHIRAMEEGNYRVFVAPVYIRGFARTYATLLKLDVAAVLAELDAELGQHGTFREPPAFSGKRGGVVDLLMLQLAMVNWRVALPSLAAGLILVSGVLGYRAWRGQAARDPLSNLGPGQYEAPASRAGDTLPLPGPPTAR
jgi:cytoskeletal protein RodZ